MTPEKLQMFENRLLKNYKHRIKQAKRQNISCWRLYDHDLPEYPICVEIYEDYIYIAEYTRRHALTEEEHAIWLADTKTIITTITGSYYDRITHVKACFATPADAKAAGYRASKR